MSGNLISNRSHIRERLRALPQRSGSLRWIGGMAALLVVAVVGLVVGQTAAKGPGQCSAPYFIDVTLPTRARWTMCWEERANEGIVLYDVTYTPPDGPERLVLAQANLAQLHVPYDDSSKRLHDLTDFGLGGDHLADLTPEECPGGNLLASNDKNVLCQILDQRGHAFKYYPFQLQGHKLTLFSVSQVGAYNYVIQWEFYDSGDIEPAVGATGRLQFYTNAEHAQHGWPLNADNTSYGLSHTHNYYWRLDFDLVSPADDLVEEIAFDPSSDRSTFSLMATPLTSEAARQVEPARFRGWRVKDKAITNSDGHAISYYLEPDSKYIFRGPDFEPFTQAELYVTRYEPCEKWVSFNPTLGGCASNVADFVNGQNVDGADLVVWYGHSFHHLPRDEDEPQMHAHWNSFLISPRDWTATNPLVGVTPIAPPPTPPLTGAVVALSDFQAEWQNDAVSVMWQTTSEINTASFSLLRSTNSLTWSQVYTAPSQQPCEIYTGLDPLTYRFTDTGVISPTIYSYRLQFVGAACGAQSLASSSLARAWPFGHIDIFLPIVVK